MRSILAILPAEHDFARRILRGARDAAAHQGRFSLRKLNLDAVSEIDRIAREERAAGVILFGAHDDHEEAVLRLKLPAVNVSARLRVTRLPRVIADNPAVGRAAAEHLLGRGYTRQVFVGASMWFARQRKAGWEAAVREAGGITHELKYHRRMLWPKRLNKIPLPLGIVGCFDSTAARLLTLALDAGVNVPHEMAFMGIDDSEDICEGGAVPLSSVSTNGEAVGRAAIEQLTRLIDGHPPPAEPVLVPAGRVVARESTDAIAGAGPELNLAMQYIKLHAGEGISVQDVARAAGLSQPTLYRRFNEVLGRTPHSEIRRVQLELAKRLLTETSFPLRDIAARCGFNHANYFIRVFGEDVGMTPTQYRREGV